MISLTQEESRVMIKVEALKYGRPNNDFFLDELIRSKKYKMPVLSVIHMFENTTKLKKNTKTYKWKLGKALESFIQEVIKEYCHRHLVIKTIIVNGINGYWIEQYKQHRGEIERQHEYEQIMEELDSILEKEEEAVKIKCTCTEKEVMCFCVDEQGEWIF